MSISEMEAGTCGQCRLPSPSPVYNLDDLGSHYLQCPHVQTSNLRGNAPVLLLLKLGAKQALSRVAAIAS